jgi:hypothetical protein
MFALAARSSTTIELFENTLCTVLLIKLGIFAVTTLYPAAMSATEDIGTNSVELIGAPFAKKVLAYTVELAVTVLGFGNREILLTEISALL